LIASSHTFYKAPTTELVKSLVLLSEPLLMSVAQLLGLAEVADIDITFFPTTIGIFGARAKELLPSYRWLVVL
jgi:hypothetical protein